MSGIALVLLLRLSVPLLVFVHPLGGAVLSMLADINDFKIFDYLGWGTIDMDKYQSLDKLLDLYYLSFEYLLTRRLDDKLAKRIFSTLFFWRAGAIMTFELTGFRTALFWGPNIFEIVFLLYFLARKFYPDLRLPNDWRLVYVISVIGIFKLIHEYSLHVGSFSDLLF